MDLKPPEGGEDWEKIKEANFDAVPGTAKMMCKKCGRVRSNRRCRLLEHLSLCPKQTAEKKAAIAAMLSPRTVPPSAEPETAKPRVPLEPPLKQTHFGVFDASGSESTILRTAVLYCTFLVPVLNEIVEVSISPSL